jgi:Mechanosensitive ion channel
MTTSFADTVEIALTQSEGIFRQMAGSIFSLRSIAVFILSVGVAIVAGRLIAAVLRALSRNIGNKADQELNPDKADRLRRTETILVLSIAIIRTFLIVFALYFWWTFLHPNQQPTAVIGASALFIVLASATLGPVLRDVSSGSVMMAEQWYGVGDHVSFEPFINLKGVVERVTLRSTKVRGLSGEVIWINNQHIQAVRIAPKGLQRIAIDLFVSDVKRGQQLVKEVSKRLPKGKTLVVSPLKVTETEELTANMWRVTAVAETTLGREWLIENFAIAMLKEDDDAAENQVIVHGPIARYSDPQAEKRFARAVRS